MTVKEGEYMAKIILLVGASGSGKTTIGKELEQLGIEQLVSFTTRDKRVGELEGVDYYFLEKELDYSELAEHSTYNGNSYGLLKSEVNKKLSKNRDVYFICNKDGAEQIIEKYPNDYCYVWIEISEDLMIDRMLKRGDSEENVKSRVEHAADNNEFDLPEKVGNLLVLQADNSLDDNVSRILKHVEAQLSREG